MTKQEFEQTAFRKGDKVEIRGNITDIIGVDFDLMLIGTVNQREDIELDWNIIADCTYIPKKD